MTDKIMASSTCKEFYARPSANSCTSSAPTPWIGETSVAVGWGDIWRNSGRDAVRGADAHGDDTTGASSAPGGCQVRKQYFEFANLFIIIITLTIK